MENWTLRLLLGFVRAMPKLSCSAVRERKTPSLTEMCTRLSRNRREKYYSRVLDKKCLVAITSTSPKVGVTANKLVPRKEKMGS